MELNAVMDGLGTRLSTISGLRVFDYPPKRVPVPAAIVEFPESIDYDQTYAGGADSAVFPVDVLVAAVSDRASRDVIAPYAARSGAKSVKAALQADPTLAGAAKSLRVQRAVFREVTVADVVYLAVSFDVEVFA